MNRFLAKELRKALTDLATIKSTKCRTCESRSIEINELQAKIAEWKSKYVAFFAFAKYLFSLLSIILLFYCIF